MADRVHPRNSPPLSETMPPRAAANPSPAEGAYVIKVPNNRHALPQEYARRLSHYHRRETSRCPCCCCLAWLSSIVVVIAVVLAATAAVLYSIFLPEVPVYAIQRVVVRGMNLTSPSSTAALSPEFEVTVRADNGNEKIGIFYEDGSYAKMFYKNTLLCNGALPAFYQPTNNVTMIKTVLKSNGVELTTLDQTALVNAATKQSVPLTLKLRAPVKIKVGSVTSWKVNVNLDCHMTVDQLTAQARMVSRDCRYRVELW